jgi:PhzF family phenazine biosynthesis protein
MSLTIHQVDAFTDKPFGGNPAAVILLPEARDEVWMQHVAMEMNLSETAFLVRRADGSFDLRWFTPTVEVDMCGHATLASAHILFETGVLPSDAEAGFHTRTGLHTARRDGDNIVLNFPRRAIRTIATPAGLPEALGAAPLFAAETQYGQEMADYLIEVDSEKIVRALTPDIGALKQLGARGVIVTSSAQTDGYDFVSRFFAPGVGIDEDPVTGSAHCALAPYWSDKLGKEELVGYQASPRGGTVRVTLSGDRVLLAGRAVTVMRGELLGI